MSEPKHKQKLKVEAMRQDKRCKNIESGDGHMLFHDCSSNVAGNLGLKIIAELQLNKCPKSIDPIKFECSGFVLQLKF